MPLDHSERHLPAGTTWDTLNADSNGRLVEHARTLHAEQHLTWMEAQCLTLRKGGYSNGEIAEIFVITPHTVDNHFHAIKNKRKNLGTTGNS